MQVTARDFVALGSISRPTRNSDGTYTMGGARISIGGVMVTDSESVGVSSTGDATFEMTLPNDVASGTQNLVVSDGSSDIVNTGGARFNMVISRGAAECDPQRRVSTEPDSHLSGRGFSTGGSAEINVAGSDATISGSSKDLGPRDGKFTRATSSKSTTRQLVILFRHPHHRRHDDAGRPGTEHY